jgi:hypothetical protein
MGHYIQGLIFHRDLVPGAKRLIPSGKSVSLAQDLCFMPITDKVLADLRLAHPEVGEDKVGFERLSGGVEHVAVELSREGPVAYIETEYNGGEGAQASVAWRNGTVVLPPRTAESGPINEALVLLGVARQNAHDEFDAVGLGQYRSNSNWFHKGPAA